MRLICPNCGAQYEVADDVIPPTGRDVQCSNCGHTWFEMPGASEAAEAEEMTRAAPTAKQAPPAESVAEPVAEPDAEPEPEPEPGPEAVEQTPVPDAAPAAAARSAISPQIAGILREEAAREEAARRAETAPALESQPDLGLEQSFDPEDQRAEEARRRMARLRGEPAPAIGAPMTPAANARRELLPDIEQINSTLRATSDRPTAMPPETFIVQDQRRGGFGTGFVTVLLLAAAFAAIYAFAPRIAAAVPQAEPVLTRYVALVDEGRLWLDLKMQTIIESLSADNAETPETAPESSGN